MFTRFLEHLWGFIFKEPNWDFKDAKLHFLLIGHSPSSFFSTFWQLFWELRPTEEWWWSFSIMEWEILHWGVSNSECFRRWKMHSFDFSFFLSKENGTRSYRLETKKSAMDVHTINQSFVLHYRIWLKI